MQDAGSDPIPTASFLSRRESENFAVCKKIRRDRLLLAVNHLPGLSKHRALAVEHVGRNEQSGTMSWKKVLMAELKGKETVG